MADLPPYARAFSFTGYQANKPSEPLPGAHIDRELDDIAARLQVVGKSAYDLAVLAGFTGTRGEWLLSLVGPRGRTGDAGVIQSVNGKSAQAITLNAEDVGGVSAPYYLRREKWRGPTCFDFIQTNYHDAIEAGTSTDDVTDGLNAFAASLGQGALATSGQGRQAYLVPGLYNFGGTISFNQIGTRLLGSGLGGAVFRLRQNLGVGVPAVEFRQKRTGYSQVGSGVDGLRIDMGGFTGLGLKLWKPYDGWDLKNVYVDNVADADNAFWIGPDPLYGPTDIYSQGLVAQNCIGAHKNATAAAPLWYAQSLNEAVFILCKAFGCYGGISTPASSAPCNGFQLVDCNGLVFLNPSAAFCSEHAFLINSTGGSVCRSIIIDTPTIEGGRGVLKTTGAAGDSDTNRVLDVEVRSPRRVYPSTAHPSGDFLLTRCRYGKFEIKDYTANCGETRKNRFYTNVGAYVISFPDQTDRIECLPDVFPQTKIEAQFSANQTIPADGNNFTKAAFNNEFTDRALEFDPASQTWTVQQYGRYRVEIGLSFLAGTNGGQIAARLVRNGQSFRDLFQDVNTATLRVKKVCSVEVDLSPNDTVFVQFLASQGGTLEANSTATYLRVTPINNGYVM